MGYYVFHTSTEEEDEQQADLEFHSHQYVSRRDVNHLFDVLRKGWLGDNKTWNYVCDELNAFSDKKARFFAFGTRVSHEPFFLLNGSGWYEAVSRLQYCVNWSPGPNRKFRCKISAPTHHRYPYKDLSDNRNSLRSNDDDDDDDEEYNDPSQPPAYTPAPRNTVSRSASLSIPSEYSEDIQQAFFENVSWLHYEIFERCRCFTQSSFEDYFDLVWMES